MKEKVNITLQMDTQGSEEVKVVVETPLCKALLSADLPDDTDRVVLDCGSLVEDFSDDTENLLEVCKTKPAKVLDFMINHKLKPIDEFGMEEIFECCKSSVDPLEKLKLIADAGGNLLVKDDAERSLLHIACEYGSMDMIKYLVDNGLLPCDIDIDGHTPLYYCCNSKDHQIEKFQYLCLNGGDIRIDQGDTLLHKACSSSPLETVKYLSRQGLDVNSATLAGDMPLHCCSKNPFDPLEILKYIVSVEADIEAVNFFNVGVLHSFCQWGNLACVQFLVEKGLSVDSKDDSGRTPLHYTCESKVQALEKLKYLEDKGGDFYEKDIHKRSLLHIACGFQNLEFIEYLVSRNLRVNDIDLWHQNTISYCCKSEVDALKKFEFLINIGGNIMDTDDQAETLLHITCRWCTLDLVKYFVDKGLSVNYENNFGFTPLFSCCLSEVTPTDKVQYLLSKGAKFAEEDRLYFIEKAVNNETRDFFKNNSITVNICEQQ